MDHIRQSGSKIAFRTSKSSKKHMEVTKLPPAAVTTAGFAALKCSSWKRINCDFTRFGWKSK